MIPGEVVVDHLVSSPSGGEDNSGGGSRKNASMIPLKACCDVVQFVSENRTGIEGAGMKKTMQKLLRFIPMDLFLRVS
ncbi:MAG TPA: hypothetical protein ENN05_02055 [Deltaproteobacteria bacterium]|nr:hypothetical protein [Deltaproteobacteria bacterium]